MLSISIKRIPINLPILDAQNYDKWCKQTNVYFGYKYVLDVIKNGINPLVKGATDAQRTTHKKEKINDLKALYLIHQCVDDDNFEKVGD